MGGVVADQFQRLGVTAGDEHDSGVPVDRRVEVDQLAVELHGQRGAGEAGTDGLGHVVPVTGASNWRTEPSGRVMAGMGSVVLLVAERAV